MSQDPWIEGLRALDRQHGGAGHGERPDDAELARIARGKALSRRRNRRLRTGGLAFAAGLALMWGVSRFGPNDASPESPAPIAVAEDEPASDATIEGLIDEGERLLALVTPSNQLARRQADLLLAAASAGDSVDDHRQWLSSRWERREADLRARGELDAADELRAKIRSIRPGDTPAGDAADDNR